MKRMNTRLFALLLAAVMAISVFPASARERRDDDAVPATPVGEEIAVSTSSVATPVHDDSDAPADLMAAGDLAIPGYKQVTNLRQIKSDREYLIVAQAPNGTFYALYLNADGTSGHSPGTAPYPDCTATLTISGETVSAVSTANTGTSIDMSNLHVTITNTSGSSYTIKNSTHAVQIDSQMYVVANSAPNLTLSFVTDQNRFSAYHSTSGRYITFNVNGATSTETHYPNLATGFCGMRDDQTVYVPVYLFIEGDLPVEPGMNLATMLSGDKIDTAAGVPAENENPDGQNSWVFTGGRAAQGSIDDIKGARSYAGHFEEYVRYTHAKQLQPSGESTTPYFQRHVINAAYEGQTLKNIVDTFDTRIVPLKPRAVSYLVDENGSTEANFAANLKSLIDKAFALQGGTGMIVIETLSAADKDAVDNAITAAGYTEAQKGNILVVNFNNIDKTNGYPNASGHFAMAKQLADAVVGSVVSTAANWPYRASGDLGTMATDFPDKTSLDHAHGYTNPTTLSEGQQAIKTKVENKSKAMTWLFMGDSITHGAAWTGGYDTLAQLFEKFVKDDLDRPQDVVINAGSSGATIQSTVSDLNRRLVKYSPDVVVLMIGTNNANQGTSADTFKSNLRTILDKIMEKGATPVLRTPPPTTRSGYDIATYAGYVRDVAAESAYDGKVILVDQYGLWIQNEWSDSTNGVFSRDTLHPDEAGHLWFAHQLIRELALWKEDAQVCRLEYKEMKEQPTLTLPGYTQLTDMYNLDSTKGYLIVSQNTNTGEFYALYPSVDGETLGAGELPTPNSANDGARVAKLTVSGQTVSAVWLKDNSAQDMEKLLFTIEHTTGNNYIFTAFNGRHLNMQDHMFTEGEVDLAVTSRGTVAPGAFQIRNGAASRVLDCRVPGDSNAFDGNYGTDFWCPRSCNMPIYLFESTVAAPTPKESLQALIREVEAKLETLTEDDYTRASWATLQNVLKTAKDLVADTSLPEDDEQFTAARDALRQAREDLRETPVIPTPPTGANIISDWKTMVPKPADNTTGQPFASGNFGNNNFRIPAIITLRNQKGANADKNGRLLAAIDARWNHAGDACGLDTVAAYSDNGGTSWKYNFPNYFGDGTDTKQTDATAFIDPVLLEGQDGTIYLMVDIWPGGIALNTAPRRPAAATGYVDVDGTQRLALYIAAPNASATTHDYYVGDFEDGYAPVFVPMPGETPDIFVGYYIDEYYYLYHNAATTFDAIPQKGADGDKIYCQRLGNSDWVQQNVFFYNATLHVRDASYLWIVKSTDGGETWGAPQVINDQVRYDGDAQFYGVGPGAGLCMEDGTLLLPVYTWPTERAGFIYSTDNGATWHRGNNATTDHSSESCLVQLNATTVRHFYRDGVTPYVRYTDHTWNGSGWTTGTPVTTTAEKDNSSSGTQLSAIKYSKKVDGKNVVLLSTPGSTARRTAGKIHVFMINEDETMTLYNTYSVNGNAYYCYSSLSETADGDIALLYENHSNPDQAFFKLIPITDLIPAVTVTGYEGAYDATAHTVTVKAEPDAATLQYSVDGGAFSDTAPSFTNVGEHTVTVKATWGSIVREASADVVITQVTPTLSIETPAGTVMNAGDHPTFTISGVPAEATTEDITLTCSNLAHDPIELTRQDDGTYTGTHEVAEGNYTLTASYTDPNGNYAVASATYSITVAPADFDFTVQPYTGTYDGQPHSVAVTAGADITVTYCETESGDYTETKPEFTNAGANTVYYQATKGEVTVSGSANVTIAKATVTLAILCGNEDHGETHSISTADLPFTLTITGVPAQEQGKFTLTTFNDAVRNLTRNDDGTWTARPNIPPITRTYHFIATFDPTVDQEGNAIENPNYERATDEFTVTVSRPPEEVIDFNFYFVDEVEIDQPITTRGTLKVIYDGLPHGPLPALTYDEGLNLRYHVSEEDAELGTESWTSQEPTFTQPGTYTVSVMASPSTSTVARVLTVVLEIEETVIPTDLTITPSAEEFEGGGTLTLTVDGVATKAGTLTVTSTPSLSITETARGKYTVTLPNTTQTYTFTAEFSGAGSYQPAHASCSVSVTKTEAPSRPSSSNTSSTTTKVEPDGTKVTTETKPDGTKVETVEEPDGTKSVTETKTDGTTTATVEEPDGTTSVTETKPDGSKTATVEQPDGTVSSTVITPEGTASITVTDPDGEELVKTEIPATITVPETRFEDVSVGHWADEAIHKLAAIEVVNGTGGNKYSPTAAMTRGQLATVLHRFSNGKTDYKTAFKDVDSNKYYAEGVAWAAKANVVKGISEDRYAPDRVITREQLATMLCRYAKLIGMSTKADTKSLDAFVDGEKTGSWAVDSMAWCVEQGILKGKGNNVLDPNSDVTRAEVAVMLDRFLALIQK